MKKNIIFTSLITVSIITPAVTLAALEGLRGLLKGFSGLLDLMVPVIFGLALVYFFWGTAQFILHAGDAKTRGDGKQKMLWGIIALFVMVSIYGILKFIGDTVGINVGGNSSIAPGGGDSPLGNCTEEFKAEGGC